MQERKVLAKALSFKNYVGLALGSMIGVGWVIVAGDWLVKGGPLGAILGFIIGGLLLIAVGKCYAELTPANRVHFSELLVFVISITRNLNSPEGYDKGMR
jgi:amino acid permease